MANFIARPFETIIVQKNVRVNPSLKYWALNALFHTNFQDDQSCIQYPSVTSFAVDQIYKKV